MVHVLEIHRHQPVDQTVSSLLKKHLQFSQVSMMVLHMKAFKLEHQRCSA
jgi:hypothetical protein